MSSLFVRSSAASFSLALAAILSLSTPAWADTFDLVFGGPQLYPRTFQAFEQEQRQLAELQRQSPQLMWYLQHGDAGEQQLAGGLLAKRDELARAVEARRTMLEDHTLPTTLRIQDDPPPRQLLDSLAALLRRDIGQQGKTFIYASGKLHAWDPQTGAKVPFEKLLAAANSKRPAVRAGDADSAHDPRSLAVPGNSPASPAGRTPTTTPSDPLPVPVIDSPLDGDGGLFGQP